MGFSLNWGRLRQRLVAGLVILLWPCVVSNPSETPNPLGDSAQSRSFQHDRWPLSLPDLSMSHYIHTHTHTYSHQINLVQCFPYIHSAANALHCRKLLPLLEICTVCTDNGVAQPYSPKQTNTGTLLYSYYILYIMYPIGAIFTPQ